MILDKKSIKDYIFISIIISLVHYFILKVEKDNLQMYFLEDYFNFPSIFHMDAKNCPKKLNILIIETI